MKLAIEKIGPPHVPRSGSMYNAQCAGRRGNFRGAAAGKDTWKWENYDTPMMYMYMYLCVVYIHYTYMTVDKGD